MDSTRHLSLEKLDEYIGKRLPEDERLAVESHLSACDDCLEEFMMASDLLDEMASLMDEASQERVFSQVRERVGSMVRRSAEQAGRILSEWGKTLIVPNWAPQPQVRASAPDQPEDTPFFYVREEIDRVTVEIYAEWFQAEHARLYIKPFVGGNPVSGVKISLKREDGGKSARKLRDPNDFFIKEKLQFGRFELTISEEGAVLGSRRFEINEDGIHERLAALS